MHGSQYVLGWQFWILTPLLILWRPFISLMQSFCYQITSAINRFSFYYCRCVPCCRITSWFMEDGARPHWTDEVFHFFYEHFNDRIIVLDYLKQSGSCTDWPPYSQSWILVTFFFWGRYLKDHMYCLNPQTTAELEQHISAACERIPAVSLARAFANFVLRLGLVVTIHGGNIENSAI